MERTELATPVRELPGESEQVGYMQGVRVLGPPGHSSVRSQQSQPVAQECFASENSVNGSVGKAQQNPTQVLSAPTPALTVGFSLPLFPLDALGLPSMFSPGLNRVGVGGVAPLEAGRIYPTP